MQGSTLKVDPGKWNPVPKSFSYQWARCSDAGRACAPIEGATAETHVVAPGDLGHALVAIVQARVRRDVAGRLQRGDRTVGGSAGPRPARADEPVKVTGPSSSAPPVVAFVIQQGRQLTGAVGSWSGLRHDQVRLPVAPLRHGRRALQVDQRRNGPHVHARRQGRRADARLRGARDRQDGNDEGVRESRRTGRGTESQARLDRPADGRRRPRGGSDAPGLGRQLEPDSDHDRVPVAALQREWATVQAASRSHREHLHRDRRRHRARPACRRPRNRGRRIAGRGERRDSVRRRRPGDRSFERRAADSDWDEQARQTTHRVDRNLVGLGRDRLRVPVVPMRRAGRALQVSPRRYEADVHPRLPRTSARPSASPSMPPMPRALPRPTRASSARSREPAPTSYRLRNPRSRVRPSRARRSTSPTAPGTGCPPPSPTPGNAATPTAASASRSPARRQPRTRSPPTMRATQLLALVQAKAKASGAAQSTLSVATPVVS